MFNVEEGGHGVGGAWPENILVDRGQSAVLEKDNWSGCLMLR